MLLLDRAVPVPYTFANLQDYMLLDEILSTAGMSSFFRVEFTQHVGAAASGPRIIELDGFGCPADIDGGSGNGQPDGAVTVDDLLYYLNLFELGSTLADLDNGSGSGTQDAAVTIEDLLFFLARFEAGC
jgi:hypothetical protein